MVYIDTQGKILTCKYTYIIDVTFPRLDVVVSILPFAIEHSLVEKRIVKHAIERRPRSVPLLFTYSHLGCAQTRSD